MWNEHRVPLIVLAVLLLGNVMFFFTYRVQYENRLEDLEARLKESQQRLQDAQRARSAAEQQLASYDKLRADLQTLYNDRWSTQKQRFTALFDELKRLGAASSLVPRSYGFGKVDEKGSKETGVGTNVVTITFTVQGTYEQVRRLINLLELSDQFVIIDGISLAGNDTKLLTLNIRLKTLFREPAAPARAAAKQS